MTSIVTLGALCVLVGLQWVASKRCSIYDPPSREGICGSKLTDCIMQICKNGIAERVNNIKRSQSILPLALFLDMNAKDACAYFKSRSQNDLQSISDVSMSKVDGFSFFKKRGTIFMSGVVCDCCKNPCNVNELQMYCKENQYDDQYDDQFDVFGR